MDVFIRAIPPLSTERHLKDFLRAPLAQCGIHFYDVQKAPSKTFATLTIADMSQAQHFLTHYGLPQNAPSYAQPLYPLVFDGSHLKCARARDLPSDFKIKSLELQAKTARMMPVASEAAPQTGTKTAGTTYEIASVSCGTWDYLGDELALMRHFHDHRRGKIVFGVQQAIILLPSGSGAPACRISLNYYDIEHVLTSPVGGNHTLTFTLRCPPRFYEIQEDVEIAAAILAHVGLTSTPTASKRHQGMSRKCGINSSHEAVASTCFVYQVQLSMAFKIREAHTLLQSRKKIRSVVERRTTLRLPAESLQISFASLRNELSDQHRYGMLAFCVRFQLTRLAQNARLSPLQVVELLPALRELVKAYGFNAAADALRRLYNDAPEAGPFTEARLLRRSSLVRVMKSYVTEYHLSNEDNAYQIANRHRHIVLVHKVIVTPAGTYLEGPDAEVTNRVLRSYEQHIDHFLRVSFLDEDGESVRYDSKASLDAIYHTRFKDFLDGTYIIADRGFSFLGFSHSSLRSQTCWFMAPFYSTTGRFMISPLVIKDLGDFRAIRSPAKCAARIGQAFTDTTGTVEVPVTMVGVLRDVERGGYCYTDGCCTISEKLLSKVWAKYGKSCPTILQIRYAGAKGVVSLDTRLQDEQLNLRQSMVKFNGSKSSNLEICGAAIRPLPMVLNRQFIKILEDLEVPCEAFMQLQSDAVEKLRRMTKSNINVASFLSESTTSKAAQLSSLIEYLGDIGLDYRNDHFLRDVVEMAVVSKLRDIKYRGRIPVQNGVTLYGIADETGYLKEGEVYVVTEKPVEGGRQVLSGGIVVITRSPALHPGDIRLVRTVDVPADSPLNKLHNCVVFSQHGERDLPSMLSGGDLDGDLYNVIFEPTLIPRRPIAEPAAYTRPKPVDIGREVVSKDMTDFFIKFMETDQLGQICSIHMQLADQLVGGTFHQDCIRLAEMASTAVDFSKTGIPVRITIPCNSINPQQQRLHDKQVDMSRRPHYLRVRPDFMAPSPRVVVEKGGIDVASDQEPSDDDDAISALEPDTRRMRYYESSNALGHLYRAIDERRFLADLKRSHDTSYSGIEDTLITALWDHVQRANVLVQWEHYAGLARSIRTAYDINLLQTLHTYSPSPHRPLSEHELFSGTILGRAGGASARRLRELNATMRERFEEVVDFTVRRIVRGDQGGEDRDDEALPRAIACFAEGIRGTGVLDRSVGEVKSWRYIAAGVVLREMRRWREGAGGAGNGVR